MLKRAGKGLAVSLLLAGCGSPEVDPNPVKTVDVVKLIPEGANFYEEAKFSEKAAPCGTALGRLSLKQTRSASEEVKDVPEVGDVTIEYLGFPKESVFPEGSDPQNSCANDKDGIIWARYFKVPLSPPPNE